MDFSDCDPENIHSSIVSGIESLGPLALGNNSFPDHVHEYSHRNGCYYLNKNNKKTAILFGELASAEEGTETSAHGDFFKNHDANESITDKSRVRDIYALRKPRGGWEIQALFERQVANLNDIRLHGLEREEMDNRITSVDDWTKPTETNLEETILVHSKLKFKADITIPEYSQRIQRSPFLEDVDNLIHPRDNHQLHVGRPYAAEVLPDYDKKVFSLRSAKVIQQDTKDNRGNLIPPWQNEAVLRPGQLLLIEGTLYCQIIRTKSVSVKKYRITAEWIKILSPV
ncbi:hypothetical protein BDN72DRAFT_905663 [Pluteus cervinus]|uniref:Uncharacterized protein n=1 Tax=Pluteus cervinus TaxID=181527 RepID=A0ACD3A1V9_9AGAR|nr:hypothetical protein BDN72DRAFT_905663 [Pluteus cervinus]